MLQYKSAKDPEGVGKRYNALSGKFIVATIHHFDDHSEYKDDHYWSYHYFLDGMFDSLIIPDRKFRSLDACKVVIQKAWSKFLLKADLRNGQ